MTPSAISSAWISVLAKNRKFSPPLSFSNLTRGDPFRIYGKALRFLKLESSRQPPGSALIRLGHSLAHVKIWGIKKILACSWCVLVSKTAILPWPSICCLCWATQSLKQNASPSSVSVSTFTGHGSRNEPSAIISGIFIPGGRNLLQVKKELC